MRTKTNNNFCRLYLTEKLLIIEFPDQVYYVISVLSLLANADMKINY